MKNEHKSDTSRNLTAAALVFFLLYVLGYIRIPGIGIPNMTILYFQGRPVSLLQVILVILGLLLIERLPSPLRQILYVVVLLWILSVLGFLTVFGLPNILALAVLIGLFLTFLR